MGDAITTLSHMVHFVAGDGEERAEAGCDEAESGGAGGSGAHLMISCSRCSSCFWRIMTPSMMARSSGVRCERSGMSAMAGGGRARRRRQRCAGPPRAAVLCPRRDAKRATQPGGLFNNAGRANRARPTSDVSTFIDCVPPLPDTRPPYRHRRYHPSRIEGTASVMRAHFLCLDVCTDVVLTAPSNTSQQWKSYSWRLFNIYLLEII